MNEVRNERTASEAVMSGLFIYMYVILCIPCCTTEEFKT